MIFIFRCQNSIGLIIKRHNNHVTSSPLCPKVKTYSNSVTPCERELHTEVLTCSYHSLIKSSYISYISPISVCEIFIQHEESSEIRQYEMPVAYIYPDAKGQVSK